MQQQFRAALSSFRAGPGSSLVHAGLFIALAVTPAVFSPALYDDFTLLKQSSLMLASALVLTGLAWDGEYLPRHRLTRVLLSLWVVFLLISFATGIDRRGSILGYYQYRQGLVTQLSYVLLFTGAVALTRQRGIAWLSLPLGLGLAAVTTYTVIQSAGLDPVDWWVDTQARAIGTIGNANELAAYGVMALSLAAVTMRRQRPVSLLFPGMVAVLCCYVVMESQSRSGLLALFTAAAGYPVAALLARANWRTIVATCGGLAAGFLVGAALSTLTGGASATAVRVQEGLTESHAQSSGSTRVALWKGTAEVIKSAPLSGQGPDGLYLAFPIERPPELQGAFATYDLVAQSSHNSALDVAANQGIPALLALVALLAMTGARAVFGKNGAALLPEAPLLVAAMGGYVALTLLNPVSLAPHALLFVVAGSLVGASEANLPRPKLGKTFSPTLRLAVTAPAAAGLTVMALSLPLADFRANRAWDASSSGDFAHAAEEYGRASRLVPWERHYAAAGAEAWLAGGVQSGREPLLEAKAAYEHFDTQFGFASGDAIGYATTLIGLGELNRANPVITRAYQLNPHGVYIEEYVATLRLAATNGGTLHWAAKDRWVYVVPNP